MSAELTDALRQFGLELLEGLPCDGRKLPDIRDAWIELNLGGAAPDAVIDDNDDDFLDRVDTQWREFAISTGVIGPDGDFLLGIEGWPQWRWVRIIDSPRISHLSCSQNSGPEFVTAHPSGHPFVGVTTEERGVWIVSAAALAPRAAAREASKTESIRMVRQLNENGLGIVDIIGILRHSGAKSGKYPIALMELLHSAFGIPRDVIRAEILSRFDGSLKLREPAEIVDAIWRNVVPRRAEGS